MLQLKSGYLKTEPVAYTFMKRYPPLRNHDTTLKGATNKVLESPYLKLYEKAVENNPLYADEKVYPAYWYHEPQALTLAKKQYEMMQSGLSEEEAYRKAIEYVNVLESRSYEELKDLLEVVKDGESRMPFTSDKEISDSIHLWREKMTKVPYSELGLADQGEIDFMIQTKILKWNEVERERRMRDPIFVMQFEKLRLSIFPEIAAIDKRKLQRRQETKDKIFQFYETSKSRLRTTSPFLHEDYTTYFEKLRKYPYLAKWTEKEREEFSKWIIDTLAMKEVIEKSRVSQIQKYLDLLRSQFFPMVKFPERAQSYTLPDANSLRKILYENDIGYRDMGGKLFIRRFYRLPMLLFPEDTFTAALMADSNKAKEILEEPDALLRELSAAGFNESSLPNLQEKVRTLGKLNIPPVAAYNTSASGQRSQGMDLSSLDALLRDYDTEEEEAARAKQQAMNSTLSNMNNITTDDIDSDTDVDIDIDGDDILGHLDGVDNLNLKSLSSTAKEMGVDVDVDVDYAGQGPLLHTVLDRDRDAFLRTMEYDTWDEAKALDNVAGFNRQRMDHQVIVRARCAVEYEEREAARRKREWDKRGVWQRNFPAQPLQIVQS
eukprot:gene4181-8317_t